jgi:hypothetical protein
MIRVEGHTIRLTALQLRKDAAPTNGRAFESEALDAPSPRLRNIQIAIGIEGESIREVELGDHPIQLARRGIERKNRAGTGRRDSRSSGIGKPDSTIRSERAIVWGVTFRELKVLDARLIPIPALNTGCSSSRRQRRKHGSAILGYENLALRALA